MATWIVHLRLAEKLLDLIPGLDAKRFAVGNIAPDSGIPDEKWEHFDPPPEVTHFKPGDRQYLADLEFYRNYLLPLRKGERWDEGWVSFRMGYFFHLVTDNLWAREVYLPTEERYAREFAADKNFIWEIKKDWYGLDFVYLRDHPESLFWKVFLQAHAETGGLEFLPLEAVERNVAYIQEYYQTITDSVQKAYNRPYIYLSPDVMDRFVEETARQLFEIFTTLWKTGADAKGTTILHSFPQE